MKSTPANPESLYDRLLEAIEQGELGPGDALRESRLAERYGTSRTPVREALRRLEAQGLVTHHAHKGCVVAALDYDQIGELYAAREVMEGSAARGAALHAAPQEIALLRQLVEEGQAMVDRPVELAVINRRFHRVIHRSSHNRYLNQLLDTMRVHMALIEGTTLSLPERGAQSIVEHNDIVEAIAARDPDAAEKATRKHVATAYQNRVSMLLS